MKKNSWWILFIILLSVPAIVAIFHSGFFQSDDGEWMIIRFSAFHEAFRDGQIPVRFLSRLNHGYGYPVANFLYPGFMYVAETIHLIGFGFVGTIKIVLGISMIGSAVFCFLWLLRFFGKLPSFIGSLFYLYTPYHLFDLYKRGSVGEVLALAVVPFVLWQVERRSIFWSSIGIAFLILSHNTLAVLFLPIIIGYMIVRKVSSIKYQVLSIFFGLGISAFFWIPAIFELQYTVFSQTQVSEWSNYFVSYDLVGTSTLIIFGFVAAFFLTGKAKISKHRLTVFLFCVGIVSIFFAIPISAPLWQILPVDFIQFPFRFLSVTILATAFLSAFIISQINLSFRKLIVSALLIASLGFSALPYIKPSEFFDKGDQYYATNEATTTVQDEYMPVWVKEKPEKRFEEKVEIVGGMGKLENVSYNSKKITFDVLVEENVKARINTIYYPGWKAKVDSENVQIDYANEKRVMEISVPPGRHLVEATFGETPIRLAADLISLVSIVILIALTKIRVFKVF